MVGESSPRPDRSLLCIAEDPASLDVLMPYGFEVRAVQSIQEALRVLYTDSPEVVLVDTATPHYRLLLDDQVFFGGYRKRANILNFSAESTQSVMRFDRVSGSGPDAASLPVSERPRGDGPKAASAGAEPPEEPTLPDLRGWSLPEIQEDDPPATP